MFTGIVEETGTVVSVRPQGNGRLLAISAKMVPELHVDQSIAVNGVCLTVVESGRSSFSAIAVEETLQKTTIGLLEQGDYVNLERAVALGARLDGHLVQGHVDARGEVVAAEQLSTSWLFTIQFPEEFVRYLIPVGSIAVDGISLTIARLEEDRFTVAIIPYTYEHTVAQSWRPGKAVNLEFDLVGKYVARWLSHGQGPRSPITEGWLKEKGF